MTEITQAVFFGLYVAAMLGQFVDTRTTEVALGKGFVEANPVGKWLINKIGIDYVYPIKCGLLPALALIPFALDAVKTAFGLEAFIAALGWVIGVRGYLLLKKSGLKFSDIF